jgi:hypothetical protein
VSDGFSNPIIGGGGALVYPAIYSPGFNVANPPASVSPSWAILKTGVAYFFGLILTGGTLSGPDYVINPAGIFIYSGAPALGNLIGSWAGAAGVDAKGNAYPAGLNVTAGAISGSTFSGPDYVINAAGVFIYSGAPAAGNLIGSWAGAAGVDAKGNAYPQGLNITLGAISGASITGSTVTAGDTIINASGVFVYSGAPAAGNLIVSIARLAGTDAFANKYLGGGVTSYDNAGLLALNHTGGVIQWYSFTAQPGAVFTFGGASVTANSAGMITLASAGGVTSLTIADGGTGNLYRAGHLVVGNLGSNQLVNSTGFTLFKSVPVIPGNYRIRAEVQINTGSTAAGLPIMGWAHGSTAGIALWVSRCHWYNAAGTGFTGQYTHAAAYPGDFNGPTMAASTTYVYTAEIFVVVNAAGVIDLAAACSIATDTFSILTGSYIELIPELARDRPERAVRRRQRERLRADRRPAVHAGGLDRVVGAAEHARRRPGQRAAGAGLRLVVAPGPGHSSAPSASAVTSRPGGSVGGTGERSVSMSSCPAARSASAWAHIAL